MVSGVVRCAPEDPFWLVESCQRAIEWMLRSHAASGRTLRRGWSEVPYREEAITRLQEALLPAMAALLERVGEIDRRVEGQSLGFAEPVGEPVAAGLCPGSVVPADGKLSGRVVPQDLLGLLQQLAHLRVEDGVIQSERLRIDVIANLDRKQSQLPKRLQDVSFHLVAFPPAQETVEVVGHGGTSPRCTNQAFSAFSTVSERHQSPLLLDRRGRSHG
jgi:hypothetical protein